MAEESTTAADESQSQASLGDGFFENPDGNDDADGFPDVEGADISSALYSGGDADGEKKPDDKSDKDEADSQKADDQQEKTDEKDKGEKPDDWDKDRQAKDIELANSRKRLEEQQGQINELTKAVKDLSDSGEKEEADDDDDEDEIEEIDEYSDATTIAKALKSRDKTIKKLADQLKGLRTEIAEDRQQRKDDKFAADAKAEAMSELNAFLKKMDKDFGEPIRNEAQAAATKYFVEQGYNATDNPPDIEAYNGRVLMECKDRKHAAELKEAKSKAKPGAKPKVPSDTGSGGGTAMTPATGSLDEMTEVMVKAGKFG